MNHDILAQSNAKFDRQFADDNMDFVKWWAKHSHNDSDPRYSIAPRVAYKCERYRQEYLEAKQIGLSS